MVPQVVTFGQADRAPRGDYSFARPDYTCEQDWNAYTPDDHALYARLVRRQSGLLPGAACTQFVSALHHLDNEGRIPDFAQVSERLRRITGWEIVAVPGLIPEQDFFNLLAQRRFPVTRWIRSAAEFDYIVEPDLFHDLFGHVPLLFNPVFADYMQAFGRGGQKAYGLQALQYLARLYWYTVEFGLIHTTDGLRAYGAGIISSGTELHHALHAPEVRRIGFEPVRVMRSRYKIDSHQETYFVIDDFSQLFESTSPDFAPIYDALRHAPDLPADASFPDDRLYAPADPDRAMVPANR